MYTLKLTNEETGNAVEAPFVNIDLAEIALRQMIEALTYDDLDGEQK